MTILINVYPANACFEAAIMIMKILIRKNNNTQLPRDLYISISHNVRHLMALYNKQFILL